MLVELFMVKVEEHNSQHGEKAVCGRSVLKNGSNLLSLVFCNGLWLVYASERHHPSIKVVGFHEQTR